MDPAFELSAAPVSHLGGEELAEIVPRLQGVEKSHPLEPGQTIELGGDAGRLELLRRLGKGGMAEVFLARKVGPATFVREVALKCMIPGLDLNERAQKAFVYEARLASRLRHPNIAEAYDLVQVGDRYYLILEYIDGVTSRAAMRMAQRGNRPLTEGLCCHIAASIADALHHAHTLADAEGQPLGIVHRDVSAKNVMIARSGAVKLLDFGIALARMQGRDHTRTGALKGTFSYLSPEQILGDPLDGRSDLFGLAILLLELLTGHRVFDAGNEAGTIHRISECSPAVVMATTAALPRRLARICDKALTRRPADRFQDGAEFANALRRHLARRRIVYGPIECAADLRELELLGDHPLDDLPDSQDASTGESGPLEPMSLTPAGHERDRVLRRSRVIKPARAIGLVLLALTVLSPSSAMKGPAEPGAPEHVPDQGQTAKPAPPAAVDLSPPAPSANAVPQAEPAPEPAIALLEGPVVRPKRPLDGARAAHTPGQSEARPDRKDRPARRIATTAFADRPSVESASATLVRGTLVPARLTRSIDLALPGQAEAVVSEDVISDGVLIVPKGSTVVCFSRRFTDGRVPLSCDTIRTEAGQLSFQGVAVGNGQRLGLRALDNEVAAGTAFVVYVNAPAALR